MRVRSPPLPTRASYLEFRLCLGELVVEVLLRQRGHAQVELLPLGQQIVHSACFRVQARLPTRGHVLSARAARLVARPAMLVLARCVGNNSSAVPIHHYPPGSLCHQEWSKAGFRLGKGYKIVSKQWPKSTSGKNADGPEWSKLPLVK